MFSMPFSLTSKDETYFKPSFSASFFSSLEKERTPIEKTFSIPTISETLLETQAWEFFIPRYSSLKSRCASMKTTETFFNVFTAPIVRECSPPIRIGNFGKIFFTASSTAPVISSTFPYSSRFPAS